MTMNTKGAVVGGTVGALIGGLAGFFAEHAMSKRRRMAARIASKRQAEYTAGGAVVGGALGAYFGGTKTAAALPSSGGTSPSGGGGVAPSGGGGVTNTSSNGAGSYWASLSIAQQSQYKDALFTWYSNNTAAANGAVAGLPNYTAASALDDVNELTALTDAYQTANGLPQQDGIVDSATYQAVTQ